MNCQCGVWSGQSCDSEARPAREMAQIEFVPEWLRESHRNAGHTDIGDLGRTEGVVLLFVRTECAEFMRREDPDWTRVVKDQIEPSASCDVQVQV